MNDREGFMLGVGRPDIHSREWTGAAEGSRLVEHGSCPVDPPREVRAPAPSNLVSLQRAAHRAPPGRTVGACAAGEEVSTLIATARSQHEEDALRSGAMEKPGRLGMGGGGRMIEKVRMAVRRWIPARYSRTVEQPLQSVREPGFHQPHGQFHESFCRYARSSSSCAVQRAWTEVRFS